MSTFEDWSNSDEWYLYVKVDGAYLKRNCDREFENVVIWVAISVNEDKYREVFSVAKEVKKGKDKQRLLPVDA